MNDQFLLKTRVNLIGGKIHIIFIVIAQKYVRSQNCQFLFISPMVRKSLFIQKKKKELKKNFRFTLICNYFGFQICADPKNLLQAKLALLATFSRSARQPAQCIVIGGWRGHHNSWNLFIGDLHMEQNLVILTLKRIKI